MASCGFSSTANRSKLERGQSRRGDARRVRTSGADFYVTRRIPSGAGLGGSSADAAGVINAYRIMYGVNASEPEIKRIAFSVGSDVPYMLSGGYADTGTGENVTKIDADVKGKILLCGRGKVDRMRVF
ncbi:MAG: hypothetical protein ACLUSP_09810 [Christensenellales bacterium]